MERYKSSWYTKRITQNQIIKNFLIDIICVNKEDGFPWTIDELQYLNYEDLFEIAVVAVDKNRSIVLGAKKDWNCGHDGKVSVVRMHNNGKTYSAGIAGCGNKERVLALVYEGIQQKFYFFNFPVTCNEHNVPFELDTGEPKRSHQRGKGGNYMWKNYECSDFYDMVSAERSMIY